MTLLLMIGLIVLIVVIMRSRQEAQGQLGGGSRQLGGRGRPTSKAQQEQAARRWAAVRRVAEEDVTQLGQQVAATPVPESLDPEAAHDFDSALEAYERAKEALASAEHPDDLQWVSRSLDDGRYALACLEARKEGRELPNRRPPCFFDQRHGQSVADAQWAPGDAALRDVPVCAACQADLADGRDPQARLVPTASGDRPYYDAGPEYGPWARGWYAASGVYMLNNILMGTMLMNAMYLPMGHDYFDGGADGGGDAGGDGGGDMGGDGGGDMGGGDFGGGDMGGGDFGGGFDFGF